MEEVAQPVERPADPSRERDVRLARRAREGDLDAFNQLVEIHQNHLLALSTRLTGDVEAAHDAVQEAFIRAYRNLGAFHGDSFRAWLIRIAINTSTDILRVRKRRPSEPYPEREDEPWEPRDTASPDPEREAIRRAQSRALSAALGELTDDQRAAIVLYDVEGFDYPEIARLTGVSLGTVKSRIHRGRLALRALLEDSMELFRD
ncbi:MAG: sigma-70 family RNA polymerase sigma factor [Chloroflexi bacterium]|nr:sigma-70 family RNA polymerase sigma factor [Chloroflexota bacterium]